MRPGNNIAPSFVHNCIQCASALTLVADADGPGRSSPTCEGAQRQRQLGHHHERGFDGVVRRRRLRLEARTAAPLAVDPFAEVFCRAAGGMCRTCSTASPRTTCCVLTRFGSHFVTYQVPEPGTSDAYFRAAAAAGVRRLSFSAAGLDSRAYRLDWPAGTTVFELDQPRVPGVQTRDPGAVRARRRRGAARSTSTCVDDWPSALRDNGFQPDEPATWIAEGLISPPGGRSARPVHQHRLAVQCRQPAGPGGPADGSRGVRAKVEAKASEDMRGQWWQLVCQRAGRLRRNGFPERNWTARPPR